MRVRTEAEENLMVNAGQHHAGLLTENVLQLPASESSQSSESPSDPPSDTVQLESESSQSSDSLVSDTPIVTE